MFPDIQMVAVTATAPPKTITLLKKALCIEDCKVTSLNPNRHNIYLEVKQRDSNSKGFKGYENILLPIAEKLYKKRTAYPMTINL